MRLYVATLIIVLLSIYALYLGLSSGGKNNGVLGTVKEKLDLTSDIVTNSERKRQRALYRAQQKAQKDLEQRANAGNQTMTAEEKEAELKQSVERQMAYFEANDLGNDKDSSI